LRHCAKGAEREDYKRSKTKAENFTHQENSLENLRSLWPICAGGAVQIEELLTARDEALSEQAEGGFYHDVWQLRKRFAGISSFRRRVRAGGWF